jgi:hypothetical protein
MLNITFEPIVNFAAIVGIERLTAKSLYRPKRVGSMSSPLLTARVIHFFESRVREATNAFQSRLRLRVVNLAIALRALPSSSVCFAVLCFRAELRALRLLAHLEEQYSF